MEGGGESSRGQRDPLTEDNHYIPCLNAVEEEIPGRRLDRQGLLEDLRLLGAREGEPYPPSMLRLEAAELPENLGVVEDARLKGRRVDLIEVEVPPQKGFGL